MAEEIVVTPGAHEIVGRRAGYREARARQSVEEGATADVNLRMELDPDARAEDLGVLALALPDAPATLRVDGERVAMSDGRAEIPVGPHDIVLEVHERVPYRESLEISANDELALAPQLRWTDGARGTRTNRASNLRTVGWVLGLTGVAAAGVGIGVAVYGSNVGDEWQEIAAEFNAPGGCLADGTVCSEVHGPEKTEKYFAGEPDDTLYFVAGAIAIGAGIVALGVGITLLLTTDSEEDIDAAASAPTARLRIGPGSVELSGTF
jgi:hypothetical protein